MIHIIRIFLILLMLFISFSATSQSGSIDNIPRKLERKFKKDAVRLALRAMEKKDDLRYQNIAISPDSIKMYYKVLTEIYLTHPVGKTLAKCNIHTFPNPSVDAITVIYKRDAKWATLFREGISETDDDDINNLLDEYNLKISKHVQLDSLNDALSIVSSSPLNMAALANEFYNIEDVVEVDLGLPINGGNDIQFTRTDSGFKCTYFLTFGSLAAEHPLEHYWVFSWNKKTSEVSFLGDFGEPVPEWMKCID